MHKLLIIINICLLCCTFGCTQKESTQVAPEAEDKPVETADICIPPFAQIDTSTVRMQMKIDGIFYKPLSNFDCIMYNFFLNTNQLWINGSTYLGFKVVTLMMPPDIQPGTYPIGLNSLYDARYVPSINSNNFLPDIGTLVVTVHDVANHHIEGGFSFHATCLDCPTLPSVDITEGCFNADY